MEYVYLGVTEIAGHPTENGATVLQVQPALFESQTDAWTDGSKSLHVKMLREEGTIQ